jgi:transcriptional regulator with XRE-family HTH domain
MAILNPKALLEARKKKGWTQSQLSEATKPQISVSTISRIERGKPSRVRESTLKQFAAVLGVNSRDLSEPEATEPDLVKLPMGTSLRNALALVARRYRVGRRFIVELAPLLFYIAAEQSLAVRQKRLEDIREAAKSLENLQTRTPHLPSLYPVDEEALRVEEKSIKAQDLFGQSFAEAGHDSFGRRSESYDEEEENPLAAFLSEALEKTRGPNDGNEPVRCPPSWGSPSYWICYDEAAELVGGDEQAAGAILSGHAALHEMPKGSPEQRAAWARSRLSPFLASEQGEGF